MRRSLVVLLPLLLAPLACGGRPRPAVPPILLVTFEGLRADAVGRPPGTRGLTPHLDALGQDASYVGSAIAASSATAPAMASLLTGLQPWGHQVLRNGDRLPEAVETLAEALRARGYRTLAFRSTDALRGETGFAQGFDRFENLDDNDAARAALSGLGERDFVWVHIDLVGAGYRPWSRFLDRLENVPPDLPPRLARSQLEHYYDPAQPMSAVERRTLWAMYCLSVARADDQLGTLLDALRRSGRYDQTLIAVTADVGEEFGENGQSQSGGNLGRPLIEVPLWLKLPAGDRRPVEPGPRPVAAARLFATLVEAAGAHPVPAAAPSLFHRARGALAELYARNGVNQFALVDGDVELVRTVEFAPPEPEYYAARRARAGLRLDRPLREPAARIFDRLSAAFLATPPFRGRGTPPRLELWRWVPGGVEPLDDAARRQALAAALEQRWREFSEAEGGPAEERQARGWYIVSSPSAMGTLGSIAQR